jgi:tRNA nucleotidyltransferase/poly(A) polymerase
MPKIAVPAHIATISRALDAAGYESVVVGGSVRDSLLRRKAKDWDLATNATPEQVRRIFPQTVGTTRFGTALVPLGGELIEITTYRTEADYSDFRRPDRVEFTGDLRVDLSRRDLTVNAIAYNPITDALIDPFGGQDDLNRRLLRAVGVPQDRFAEDALRLLRVVRFVSSLGFAIERSTAAAMRSNAHLAAHLATERVGTEYARLLAGSGRVAALRAAAALGLIDFTLPEIAGEAAGHGIDVLASLPAPAPTAALWAALYHHSAGDARSSASVLRHRLIKLALSEDLAMQASRLVEAAVLPQGNYYADEAVLWRALRRFNRTEFESGLDIALGCLDTTRPRSRGHAGKAGEYQRFIAQARAMYDYGLPAGIKDLSINGDDLVRLGVAPGPTMGALLRDLLEATTEKLVPNDREALLRYIKNKVSA